jgi:hypothetical protein
MRDMNIDLIPPTRYRNPLVYTVRLVDGGPFSAPPRIVSTTRDGSHGVLVAGCSHSV